MPRVNKDLNKSFSGERFAEKRRFWPGLSFADNVICLAGEHSAFFQTTIEPGLQPVRGFTPHRSHPEDHTMLARLPAIVLSLLFVSSLAAEEVTIRIDTPLAPPAWAVLERELLRAN